MKKKPEMCECGRAPKEVRKGRFSCLGCVYCNQLDGYTKEERDVISILRSVHYGSAELVVLERGVKWKASYRHLRRMVLRGRLEQFIDVIDADPTDELQYRVAPLHRRCR